MVITTLAAKKSLDEAIKNWTRFIDEAYPTYADIEVDTDTSKPSKRMWSFCTDAKKKIWMKVNDPEMVEKYVRKVLPVFSRKSLDKIAKLYDIENFNNVVDMNKLINNLLHDHYFWVLNHELFHTTDCPEGDTDRKELTRALAEGISEELYHVKKPKGKEERKDVVLKTSNCRNLAMDEIVDDLVYTRMHNKAGGSLEEKVNATYKKGKRKFEENPIKNMFDGARLLHDVIEVAYANDQSLGSGTAVFSLSRLPYLMLYVKDAELRTDLFNYFKRDASARLPRDDFDKRVKRIFKQMVAEVNKKLLTEKKINIDKYNAAVDEMYDNLGDNNV
jgi:hypothetical protein